MVLGGGWVHCLDPFAQSFAIPHLVSIDFGCLMLMIPMKTVVAFCWSPLLGLEGDTSAFVSATGHGTRLQQKQTSSFECQIGRAHV